jgi:uncharacterized BrkB/YihY/UPF0761 family membrane protein
MVTVMSFFPKPMQDEEWVYRALYNGISGTKAHLTWYVGTIVNFGTIYGPLSAFFVFLLWVFYSSCIFLIGAEMVHNLSPAKK